MIFEIHTPNNQMTTLKNVVSLDSIIPTVKGYANAVRCNVDTLVLYQITSEGKTLVDLSSYNMQAPKRHSLQRRKK